MVDAPSTTETSVRDAEALRAEFHKVREHLNHMLKGKADVVEMVLVCLLAQGHLLLEDKPG
ncbi:MAG: hypothetical protein KDA58_14210, partial [Planctomycetaceae bacterium]|nr:hypothetical protein [Planctomycetaceae bacterium]